MIGALAPDLRDQLQHPRNEILTLLRAAPAATEFALLTGGQAVPVPALRLAIHLEARGFRQSVLDDGAYAVEPSAI